MRIGSGGITGAWMSIALARTNVDTSKVMFDMAVFSNIDLQRATIDFVTTVCQGTKSKSRICGNSLHVDSCNCFVAIAFDLPTILNRKFLKIRDKFRFIRFFNSIGIVEYNRLLSISRRKASISLTQFFRDLYRFFVARSALRGLRGYR